MTTLFVCTGNTCRSPLCEVIYRKIYPAHTVFSRGIYADFGGMASSGSCYAAEKLGLSLDSHKSAPLQKQDIDRADKIFVMTEGHLYSILSGFPAAKDKTALLSPYGIQDPFGCDDETYLETAYQIYEIIEGLWTTS